MVVQKRQSKFIIDTLQVFQTEATHITATSGSIIQTSAVFHETVTALLFTS